MIVRVLALAALVSASACGSVVAPPDEGPTNPGGDNGTGGGNLGEASAEVQRGAELFSTNCQACHGANAAGGGVYSGSLQGRAGIHDQVRNGGGGMPAFPASTLPDADVAAIEAYLVWLAEPGNGGGGTPLDPFAANCAACHGPTGEGTNLAPQIRSPHEGYATWVVRNGRDTMGFPQPMPKFTEQQVSAAALDEIFTFLHSRPLPEDGEGLYLRFCGNCHGPNGSGGVVGASAREEAGDAGDFREAVRSGEGGARYGSRGGYMPARGSGELSDADLEKIRAFLGGGSGGDDDDDYDDDDDDDDGGDDDFATCAAGGNGLGGLALGAAALALSSWRRQRGAATGLGGRASGQRGVRSGPARPRRAEGPRGR